MSVASRSEPFVRGERRLGGPLDALLLFGPLLSNLPRERVAVAYLRAGGGLIDIEIVTEGDEAAARLPASAILRAALLAGADAMILAHNHPSGDARPSLADIRATRQLAGGAAALGMVLLDHLVLAPDEAFSFRATGLM